MVSEPKFKSVLTKVRAWKLYELDSLTPEITISTHFVVKTCCEFIPLTVRINFSLDNLSFPASWAEIHEWLQAESQKTRKLELDVLLEIFNSTIRSRPLTRRTEVAQVPLTFSTTRLAECKEIFPSAGDFVESFAGYILSATWRSALWVLLQSGLLLFSGFNFSVKSGTLLTNLVNLKPPRLNKLTSSLLRFSASFESATEPKKSSKKSYLGQQKKQLETWGNYLSRFVGAQKLAQVGESRALMMRRVYWKTFTSLVGSSRHKKTQRRSEPEEHSQQVLQKIGSYQKWLVQGYNMRLRSTV